MYKQSDVLATGSGTCTKCRRLVARILVGDKSPGGHREWRAVDPARGGWLPHQCPSGSEPMRKAA